MNAGVPLEEKSGWEKVSLRASSPIWASDPSLARTRERAAKPRGAEESSPFLGPSLARSWEARFARPNRRACSQARKKTIQRVWGDLLSVACLWYLLATAYPHPNLSEEQINFSHQSDWSDLPKCLKWLQKALFVLFLLFLGLFLDSSIHGNLNSPLLSNSLPLQQGGFLRKRISLVYVFHALFNRR